MVKGGAPVSASRVRKLYAERDWRTMRRWCRRNTPFYSALPLNNLKPPDVIPLTRIITSMEMMIDALAGTLESSDVMVRIGPSSEPGIQLELDSIVKQQFGAAIERVVEKR
jgi:hypothetical protein